MKLFLREHLPLMMMFFIQLTTVSLIFWFGEYQNVWTFSYAIFLGITYLVIYLLYRYVRYHSYYQRLTHPPRTLEETVSPLSDATVAHKLQQLLEAQYRLYQEQLYHYQTKQEEHLTFVNLWVHQMKTPLSVISLILQEETSPAFENIQDEVEKVSSGLEMILYVSRLDAFEKDFQVEKLNLSSLMLQVLQENKRLFIKHKIYPDFQVEKTLAVNSDEKWLAFVIKQIMINAVLYSAGKGKTVKITSFQQANRIGLEITDQGVGIPPQDIARVFEAHYTGDNGRKFRESTGMGLYLVREICNKLHHPIHLESTEGEGTTVRITFYDATSYKNVSFIS
jgi:two-component system, OmpR family, sensor histidine kinase YxdK